MDNRIETEVSRRLRAAGFVHLHTTWLSHRDWSGVISFATTTEHWRCFDALESLMTDAEYATTVRELWCATNGLPPDDAEKKLQQHGRQISREMWMVETDREVFASLPDLVTVYRGCLTGAETGWSWTLDRATAEHFANGLCEHAEGGAPVVLTGAVAKSDIIALFAGNWEEGEVVVPGHTVTITEVLDAARG